MLSAGSVFAGYRIERMLGAGGMGTVYLARSPELPRSDAVKVLSAELSRDQEFRARFVREADVAAALDHPNIVSVHRRGEFEGQLWIAMQFVDGTDADAALRAGAMTPARAVHIVGEVGKALDYAHRRNVIHRDVKPANFLLSGPVEADERVLLGDFGIARALGDVGLTVTGSVMATMSYAAPEVLAQAEFDGRADLYSLGCTLFRMLTGSAPFAAANGPAAVVAAHLQQPPPKVTHRVPELPARMDWVVATAMAKEPAQRFASGREFADAAAEALDERTAVSLVGLRPVPSGEVSTYPVVTQGSGPPVWRYDGGMMGRPVPHGYYPLQHPPTGTRRRGRWIAAALATVAVVAAAAVTVVTLTARSHRPTPPPPPPLASGSPNSASSTSTGPPPSPVPASALSALLLPVDQAANIVGAAELVQESFADTVVDDSPKLTEKECIAAVGPDQHGVYAGTGWTAARSQALRNPGEGPRSYAVIQAVIAFPTARDARKQVAAQKAQWSRCEGRTYAVNFPTPPTPQRYTVGSLTSTDTTLSMTTTLEDVAGAGCQRALTTRNNIAIDVVACRFDVTNQAIDIVDAIAAKVGQ
jgi:serine/threonine-protein kinase